MLAFVFELLFEIAGQFVLLALNVTVGMFLAFLCYFLWLFVRRRVWHLDRSAQVETSDGRQFEIRTPGLQVRTPLTRAMVRVRRSDRAHPEWSTSHAMHPDRMSTALDDLLIFVVPFVLAAMVALVFLFVVEVFVVAVVVLAVAVYNSVIRRHWRIVVLEQGDLFWKGKIRGLRAARDLRLSVVETLQRGDVDGALVALAAAEEQSLR